MKKLWLILLIPLLLVAVVFAVDIAKTSLDVNYYANYDKRTELVEEIFKDNNIEVISKGHGELSVGYSTEKYTTYCIALGSTEELLGRAEGRQGLRLDISNNTTEQKIELKTKRGYIKLLARTGFNKACSDRLSVYLYQN